VHPGKYLVLAGGLTADVEEAVDAGREIAGPDLLDVVYLPDVHPHVVTAIGGTRREDPGEALGVVETRTVAASILAADAGVKAARVVLREVRLADGLGGKGYVLFGGRVAEVEAAVEAALARIEATDKALAHAVIARLDEGMEENLAAEPRFLPRARGIEKEPA
jgi:microcompartment protein CcmL/EutN